MVAFKVQLLRTNESLNVIMEHFFSLSIFILVILCGSYSALAQIPFTGKTCVEKTPASPIDLRKVTGQWYEIEASPVITEWPYKCISIKVSAFYEKKSKIKIEAVHRLKNNGDVMSQFLNVSLPPASDGKDGKLVIGWTPTPEEAAAGGLVYGNAYKLENIQILATDYSNWAVVYSCRPYPKVDARTEQVWIISRYRTLESTYYSAVREAILNQNLEMIRTLETNQEECTPENDAAK